MRIRETLLIAICMSCTSVVAQIHYCVENGKKVLTDKPCGVMLHRGSSPEELEEQRRNASIARSRLAQEQYRRAASLQEQEYSRQPAAVHRQIHPSQTDTCAKARKEADSVARSIASNRVQIEAAQHSAALACGQPPPPRRERPHVSAIQSPPPTFITRCNNGFCYDNQGGVYNRNGSSHMIGPGGRSCTRTGNTVICN